jgi:cell volume regulation protein A
MLEPQSTALLLLTLGSLLFVGVLFSRASERFRVPVALVFLGVGMLAGSEGIGRVAFEDYPLAFRIGTAALVLILFDGGLNTPPGMLRLHLRPAAALASAGVVGTAALLAVSARAVGFDWSTALLLGAVVSSTDAASVFALLRGSQISLKRRVGMTLELESGLNDPVAVLLVTLLTRNLLAPGDLEWWRMLIEVSAQIAIGFAGGFGVAHAGRFVLTRFRHSVSGLYPVFTVALALLAYALPVVAGGSGFLGVYVAGLVLGAGPLPYRASLTRVHDAIAWLGQASMFMMLGLLVFPSRLIEVAKIGTVLAVFLTVVARPFVAALCLTPFGYSARQVAFIGWVGIRGAVPIILATFPVLQRVPGAERLFDLVFFMVVVNAIITGTTVPWLAKRLGVEASDPPAPRAVLEIESAVPLASKLLSFHVDDALAVAGSPVSELPFPEGSAVTLVIRGQELLVPAATTRLEPGDHVYVVTRAEDEPLVRLMFGRPEGE